MGRAGAGPVGMEAQWVRSVMGIGKPSALRQVIQALRDAATKAQQNANQQEQVSNAN